RSLPDAGLVWYQDRETGQRLLIDSSDPYWQMEWPQRRLGEQENWKKSIERCGATALTIDTKDQTADTLHRFLRLREAQGKRRRR
ncbi:MAG: hypothetical protein NTX25_10130, partial [Proteobacteria bacterium]|nr:hypothetical protein [Pseudomonadota bacterium]